MNDPDWGRVGAVPPAHSISPLGDATRWGAVDATPMVIGEETQSGQIVLVQTRDPYPRSWSLLGVLSMPAPLLFSGTLASEAVLQVTMGVGQVQILHEISLWLRNNSGVNSGLCFDQNSLNGGPYTGQNYFANNPLQNNLPLAYTPQPFAIIGGLIGQSIGIRVRYGALGVDAELPAPVYLSLIVTPYAAGSGL